MAKSVSVSPKNPCRRGDSRVVSAGVSVLDRDLALMVAGEHQVTRTIDGLDEWRMIF